MKFLDHSLTTFGPVFSQRDMRPDRRDVNRLGVERQLHPLHFSNNSRPFLPDSENLLPSSGYGFDLRII